MTSQWVERRWIRTDPHIVPHESEQNVPVSFLCCRYDISTYKLVLICSFGLSASIIDKRTEAMKTAEKKKPRKPID